MMKYFQNRFALSEKGANDLLRGIVFSTLQNLALMLPPTYLFLFLMEYIGTHPQLQRHTLWFYLLVAAVLAAVMFFVARWQYDSTYTTVYNESAKRRISIAEKLRQLPLAFFGERNLSDLTSTVMEDCTELEHTFSHAVPQLFASIISILIIAVSLFCYDWRLAAALFYVVPLALATLLLSRHLLNKVFARHYLTKRGITEQIQEGLECVQEIKSYSGEQAYCSSFDQRLKRYEQALVRSELIVGTFPNLSVVLLKLGMPTVILVGAWLLQRGDVSPFVYLAFLIVSAMVYNPIQEVCNNLVLLSYLDVRINRTKEIETMPAQQGCKDVALTHYDIEFRNVSFAYEADKQVLHHVSFTARQGEVTARQAAERAPPPNLLPAFGISTMAKFCSAVTTLLPSTPRRYSRTTPSSFKMCCFSMPLLPTTFASASAMPPTKKCTAQRSWPNATTSSTACHKAMTPSSAKTAKHFRAESANAFPLPVHC